MKKFGIIKTTHFFLGNERDIEGNYILAQNFAHAVQIIKERNYIIPEIGIFIRPDENGIREDIGNQVFSYKSRLDNHKGDKFDLLEITQEIADELSLLI